MTCPGCGHASHAKRCFFVGTMTGRYMECRCTYREELPDGLDRTPDRRQLGLPLPGLPAVQRMVPLAHQIERLEDAAARYKEAQP